MVATVRLINSGLFDELPTLKIQMSHFGGGIGRYLPRIRGLQDRQKNGTAAIPRHGRQPRQAFDRYRISNIACSMTVADGRASMMLPSRALSGSAPALLSCRLRRLCLRPIIPRGVQDDDQVAAYVNSVRALGPEARAVLNGANAEKLIPELGSRLKSLCLQ